MVKVGDAIPNVDLVEGSPGDKVNLSKELASGKGLIVGVPAAFSKSLSSFTKASQSRGQLSRRYVEDLEL